MAHDGAKVWYGVVNEDGSFSIVARVTSLDGSGSEMAPGEGNCVQQADVSSATAKVFDIGTDRDATTGTEITPAPTLTAAANFYDTLQTVGWPTNEDPHGYNFRLDLGAAYVADGGGEWRLVEIVVTLDGGAVLWQEVRVKVRAKITS